MRFELASPASTIFFLLVPFFAHVVIAQQHQVDITRLDPRASFGALTTLFKNNGPPGYGRDRYGSGDGIGAGGRGSSNFQVKDEHDTRATSGYKSGLTADVMQRAINLDVNRGSGEPTLSFMDEHSPRRRPGEDQVSKRNAEHAASEPLTAARGPSNEATASRPTINSLSPEAMALCAQEAANARQDLTAARVGAVKFRRFADSDNETEVKLDVLKRGVACYCDYCTSCVGPGPKDPCCDTC